MVSVSVDITEVRKRYEGDLDSEFREDYVVQKLADAIDLAYSNWGAAIASRLTSGALTVTTYNRIIAECVLRVLRNPEGWVSQSEGGASGSRRASVASGDLWLTDKDEEALTGILVTTSQLPGTVSLGLDRGWGS